MADANFPLIQFSKFSFGPVFPVTAPYVHFQYLNVAMLKTFMHGDLSALESKVPKKSAKIGSHIYA